MNVRKLTTYTTFGAAILLFSSTTSQAVTGTWSSSAGTGVLSTGGNWSSGGPIGTAAADANTEILTFNTSSSTTLSQTAANFARIIDFTAGGSGFTWNTGGSNLTIGSNANNTAAIDTKRTGH